MGLTIIRATIPSFDRSRQITLYWPAWRGWLYSVAGPVSRTVPVRLTFCGQQRKVENAARKLRKAGYHVAIKRGAKSLRASPELPVRRRRTAGVSALPPPILFSEALSDERCSSE